MTNMKSQGLSIETKIDDLGWPWTCKVKFWSWYDYIMQQHVVSGCGDHITDCSQEIIQISDAKTGAKATN